MARSVLGKRKSRSSTAPAIDLSIFDIQLKQQPDKVSLLLDLPAEIRNIIYQMVHNNAEMHLSRNTSKRSLATTVALPRVNKQVRDEFFSSAWLTADISTTVIDFDFRHIVTFINRLSDLESESKSESMSTLAVPTVRQITVDLVITSNCLAFPPLLRRWIKRASHPTKQGTDINYVYRVAEDSDPEDRTFEEWYYGFHRSMRDVPCIWMGQSQWIDNGRSRDELHMIYDVLGPHARFSRNTKGKMPRKGRAAYNLN